MNGTSLNGHVTRDSFSRWWHFALVLVPMFLGVAYVMSRDYVRDTSPSLEPLYHGIAKNVLIQDGTLWFRMLMFFGFLFSLSCAMGVLWVIGKIEDSEDQ